MVQGFKNLIATLIGVVVLALLLAGFEQGFAQLNRYFPPARATDIPAPEVSLKGSRSFAVPVHLLERVPQRATPLLRSPQQNHADYPDEYYYVETRNYAPVSQPGVFHIRAQSNVDEHTVYDIAYEVDENRYRVTPPVAKAPKQFTLFLGCSYTYGEGLNATETLPYFFEKNAPEYRSYNMAFHGYAPNDLLARAQSEDARRFVREPTGRVLYFFMADHVRRVVGSSSWVGIFGGDHPYFFLDRGELKQDRNFAEARPVLEFFSPWVVRSEIAKFFRVDFPRAFRAEHFDLMGRVIAGLRDEYQRKFPGARFYVVFFPEEQLTANVAAELEKHQIRYLDYSSLKMGLYTKGAPTIEDDGHPSAEANQIFAEQVAADLKAFESASAQVGAR